MKKLEISQMENLQGSGPCATRFYGFATGLFVGSLFGGPVAAMAGGTAASLIMLASVACGNS
jgi:hypothetical protein